jgi:pimeloyl-ACP methyl ester carboxylesterase
MTRFDHQKGSTLAVDGAEIYFELAGEERGLPLVLPHGGMGNVEDFNRFVEGLGEYRLIGIDARGHGRSTLGQRSLTYERLEKDVLAILQHLSINRASILGFSDGGVVGYRLAIYQRSMVDKLITIGGPCVLAEGAAQILRDVTAASWDERFPETKPLYQKLNPRPDFEAFVEASKRLWLDISAAGYPGKAVCKIECPTLIVRGDRDHLYSLAEAVELRMLIANSQLLHLPNAAHDAFNDSKLMCLLGLKEFLQS